MSISPITIGAVGLTMLALTVLISFSMARRQQDALKLERKPVPARWKIIPAGLVTILVYMSAVAVAILMLVSPFTDIQINGSNANVSSVLIWVVLGLILLGTGFYWVFVRLGLFTWKTFTLDQ